MKKNILLVQSLVLLPLLIATPLLGMQQKNRKQRRQENKKTYAQVARQAQPKEIQYKQKQQQQIGQNQNHFPSQEQQLNNYVEAFANPLYNPEAQTPTNLIASETEIINLPLPEYVTHNNAPLITEQETAPD